MTDAVGITVVALMFLVPAIFLTIRRYFRGGKYVSRYQQGYNFVLKQIQSGKPIDELYNLADNPFDSGEFERGMLAALRDTM